MGNRALALKKLFAFSVLSALFALPVGAQTTGTAVATAHEVSVTACVVGLPFSTACTFTLKSASDVTVDTKVVATGATCRSTEHIALSASTLYRINVDCGAPYDIIFNNAISTTDDPGGTASVSFQVSDPRTLPLAARATIAYGFTAATMTTTAQNTSCSSGCIIPVSIARGAQYYETRYQDSSNNILARTSPTRFVIGATQFATLTSSVSGAEPSIPNLALWETNMLTYGQVACDTGYAAGDVTMGTYYDGAWVMEEIGDYVTAHGGSPAPSYWRNCSDNTAMTIYRDNYVRANLGSTTGWNAFTYGMVKHAIRTANSEPKDRQTVLWMAGYRLEGDIGNGQAYCGFNDWTAEGVGTLIREHAYCLKSMLDANNAIFGITNQASKRETVYNHVINNLKSWVGDPDESPTLVHQTYVLVPAHVCYDKWYIDALWITAANNALIQYDEAGDPGGHHAQTLAAVEWAANFLWEMRLAGPLIPFQNCKDNLSDPTWNLTPATNPGITSGVVLNLLSADQFAWLYTQTCNTAYRQMADDLFSYGVQQGSSFLGFNGKQFNQNYSYSFNYVRRRQTSPCP